MLPTPDPNPNGLSTSEPAPIPDGRFFRIPKPIPNGYRITRLAPKTRKKKLATLYITASLQVTTEGRALPIQFQKQREFLNYVWCKKNKNNKTNLIEITMCASKLYLTISLYIYVRVICNIVYLLGETVKIV
jgi:hypothetical protein